MIRPPPRSPLFPYPTLSRSLRLFQVAARHAADDHREPEPAEPAEVLVEEQPGEQRADDGLDRRGDGRGGRSEEHTSELQSLAYLVCRLLLEKKKKIYQTHQT